MAVLFAHLVIIILSDFEITVFFFFISTYMKGTCVMFSICLTLRSCSLSLQSRTPTLLYPKN